LRVLEADHWNRKQAARALRISYRALLYKMQYAGLSASSRQEPGKLIPELHEETEPQMQASPLVD
jgi:hypothetical protein